MAFFARKSRTETRAAAPELDRTQIISADWLGDIVRDNAITRKQTENIPAVAAGVKLIADAVAGLPVKLYEERDGKTSIIEDPRCELLNGETGDSLTGTQLKRALMMDYLLDGAGYAYVEKARSRFVAVKYVPHSDVSVSVNADPLQKTAIMTVYGKEIAPHRMLRLLNGSTDGYTGRGIVQRCQEALLTSYKQQGIELGLAKSGGGRRGFLQSNRPLAKDKMDQLRENWKVFAQTEDNSAVLVLNEGVTFTEASSTLVEMQLSELKGQNAQLLSAVLGVPLKILTDAPDDEIYRSMVKTAVMPALNDFEAALNHALLLETERGKRYFAFDTRELTRGDLTTRYGAYKTALEAGFLQPDEVRNLENLEPLGLDFVRLGLQDVYYYPATRTIYTPNTGVAARVDGESKEEGTRQDNATEGKGQ